MNMEWMKSTGGNDVVVLNEKTYLSFGKDGEIKWIHLSYTDATGVRRGQMLPVALNKIKREYSTAMGKKNLTKLRSLIKGHLDGDVLSRKKFIEVGNAINREQTSK